MFFSNLHKSYLEEIKFFQIPRRFLIRFSLLITDQPTDKSLNKVTLLKRKI